MGRLNKKCTSCIFNFKVDIISITYFFEDELLKQHTRTETLKLCVHGEIWDVIRKSDSMHRQLLCIVGPNSAMAPGDETILSEHKLCCLCSLAPAVISYC